MGKNATNNFGKLIEEKSCANQVEEEFEYIWSASQEELKKIQNKVSCKGCNE